MALFMLHRVSLLAAEDMCTCECCRDVAACPCPPLRLLCRPQDNTKMSMLRNATWTLSNFCRGKPQPDFQQVRRRGSVVVQGAGMVFSGVTAQPGGAGAILLALMPPQLRAV